MLDVVSSRSMQSECKGGVRSVAEELRREGEGK